MTALEDQGQRDRIRERTDLTLFVNAGAGSGKTTALVQRVLTLVLRDGIRLSSIAAVTFTEKAGAELRDRLRAEFEKQWLSGGAHKQAAQQALDDLDGAAIGTLHSFAQRLLMEHPISAGLPPIIEILDEVGSSVAFEERWAELQTALLDDDDVAQALLLGMALGLTLKQVRSLALLLGKDWDLIEERVLATAAPQIRVPDLETFLTQAAGVIALADHCTAADDKVLAKFAILAAFVDELNAAPDTESRFRVLADIATLTYPNGQKGNWSRPLTEIKQIALDLSAQAAAAVSDVLDQCVRRVARWLAQRVLESADRRRRDGTLEFHDLLVLARDLLRRDADVRDALHEDYQRLLLDEFPGHRPDPDRTGHPDLRRRRGGRSDVAGHPYPAGPPVRRGRCQAVDLPVPPSKHRDLPRRAEHHRRTSEPHHQLPHSRPDSDLGQHRVRRPHHRIPRRPTSLRRVARRTPGGGDRPGGDDPRRAAAHRFAESGNTA